jgi:methyl-accepting chemotaxis protein
MPSVSIDSKLESLVESLSALRIATPVNNPNYETIKDQYQEASDRLSESIGKSIDDADKDYQAFAEGVKDAIATIKEATEKIEKVAKTVKLVAQVLDVVGKVVGKLVA